MKHIFNKIFILLLLCILPSTSKGEMLQGIMVEDGRISGIVTALFGKGTEYETTHTLQIDCSVPNGIYTPEIFEVEYRYFSKKDIQKALQAIGQSDQGTFQNSREGTSYVNTSKIDPSAGISKEDAAKQAIEIGIKYFEALGIEVVMCPEFKRQKGVFTVILRNCLILINANLSEEMQRIVCAHELGHALLHRKMASVTKGLLEFELFDINDQMEYDANAFAATLLLDEEELLEMVHEGHDVVYIARSMGTNVNLILLKLNEMRKQGHEMNLPDMPSRKFLGEIDDNAGEL